MFKNNKNHSKKNLKNNKRWKIWLVAFLIILAGFAIGGGSYVIVLTQQKNATRPTTIVI